MAKKIYNYEVFTNKKEELKKIQQKRKLQKAVRISVAVILVIVIAVVYYMMTNSRTEYYSFEKMSDLGDNTGVNYEEFQNGYIKYSSRGIEYQRKLGYAEWNHAFSYQNPFLVKSKEYIMVGDRGENSIMLLDVNGIVEELHLKYPILQASVSDQGIFEVTLEGKDSNFIQIYDKAGKMIAETKTSLEGSGYPLASAISPDGTVLAVSYYKIQEMEFTNSLVFYNLNEQLQGEDVVMQGGFDFQDTMIPRLYFAQNDTLVAIGDNLICYYDVKNKPEEIRKIEVAESIESIFLKDSYVGVIKATSDEKDGGTQLLIYNKKGKEKLKMDIDYIYDDVEIWDQQIMAIKDSHCTIFNFRGNILYDGDLKEGPIECVLPAGGWRTYYVVCTSQIGKVKMRFIGSEEDEKDN